MANPLLAKAITKKLTEEDFIRAADRLSVAVGRVKAVAKVESKGAGFDDTGRVIIRYEPHIFHRYTKGIYDKTHPYLSYPTLNINYPTSVDHSWRLFKEAAKLKPNAAVLACSWGMFQIMAFNYSACGCENLNQFVSRMERSEGDQLDMFCTLLLNWGLDDELRRGDSRGFARFYNGKDYEKYGYHIKLDLAFVEFD